MSDQAELIAKLSEATAGSEDLDRAVSLACGIRLLDGKGRLYYVDDEGARVYGGLGDYVITPPVTTSVDAALALIEKRLPDRLVENFGEMRDSGPLTGHWLAQLGPRGPRRRLVGPITGANLQATLDAEVLCSAETGPLALCIALLKALQAQTDAALKPEGGS